MEREKGFEPSTSTLARLHSTTELLPLSFNYLGMHRCSQATDYISSVEIVKPYFLKNSLPSPESGELCCRDVFAG
jgi:hypothetical protein